MCEELNRKSLEDALEQIDTITDSLCPASQLIIAAAHKYLEIMPRKVKVNRWLVMFDEGRDEVYENKEVAQRRVKESPEDRRLVEVIGEYMRTD